MLTKDYKKYRWFYTSSGKLVVGGKSARQNDELLKGLRGEKIIMHTSAPGSPFSVIVSYVNAVSKHDLEECAIFTGCFSRAWREGKRKAEIHIFKKSQVKKEKGMKVGTWGVSGKVKKVNVELKLGLIIQKSVLRGVPLKTAVGNEILMKVCPGKIDKVKIAGEIIKKIGKGSKETIKKDDVLSAFPAGGVRICK